MVNWPVERHRRKYSNNWNQRVIAIPESIFSGNREKIQKYTYYILRKIRKMVSGNIVSGRFFGYYLYTYPHLLKFSNGGTQLACSVVKYFIDALNWPINKARSTGPFRVQWFMYIRSGIPRRILRDPSCKYLKKIPHAGSYKHDFADL